MGLFFWPDSGRTQVWSCGGGRQSLAIIALIQDGVLPKPDIAVMVDTERERSSTWRQMEIGVTALKDIGVDLQIVRKSDFATVDVLGGEDGQTILLPGFTDITGKVGKLPNYCSAKWKREVTDRWLRRVRKIEQCDIWIGISVDEMRRVRDSRRLWCRNAYPLIDKGIRASDCIAIVQKRGWGDPSHSCCKMCPNQSDAEWLDMKINWPDDFTYAVAFEKEMQKTDPNFWLHESCVQLDQVDFTRPTSLFTDNSCASGMCFV